MLLGKMTLSLRQIFIWLPVLIPLFVLYVLFEMSTSVPFSLVPKVLKVFWVWFDLLLTLSSNDLFIFALNELFKEFRAEAI